MPLRSARLTGDPVLEECLAGRHRMLAGEQGLPVKRLQQGLLDLGRSVGPKGADGIFGPDTGAAVTAYKTDKGLTPNDPVVGPGTAKALDDDLFNDPPRLDPTFGEFSGPVVDHRMEQFVALELNALISQPLNFFSHMLGRFTMTALNSGALLGIVAESRAIDLRDRFLADADPVQGSVTADVLFDDQIILGTAVGRTIPFSARGEQRSFIVIRDSVILGRESIVRQTDGARAPVTLQGVIVHELTHVRNLKGSEALRATSDTDTNAYADTALAQARSAAGRPTAEGLLGFVEEIVARHVHWIVLKEVARTPGNLAVRALGADQLAAAAFFYFHDVVTLWDSNGYGAGINARGDAVIFHQLDQWLRLCATQSFSDDAADNQQSVLALQAAAQFCADRVGSPILVAAQEDGLFPVSQDFT